MTKNELHTELTFVRQQILVFKEKVDVLENGNWRKNISNDFDKDAIYSKYKNIIRELDSLIRREYDIEINEKLNR